MGHVLRALQEHGTRAIKVFPPEAGVLIAFTQRLAEEVVCSFMPFLSFPCNLSPEYQIDSRIYHIHSGPCKGNFH